MEQKTKEIRMTTYKNAISYKLNNRRVTVVDLPDGGVGIEFRTIDHTYTPHTINECIHSIMALTYLNLSEEASEVLLRGLANRLGYEIIKIK